jgi:glutathione S-transferase
MMTLYSMSDTCALAPHIALTWSAALPHRVRILSSGQNHEPDFLTVNPLGSVPALVLEDGGILTEATAILTYIDTLAPDAFVAPERSEQGQARLVAWLSFMSSELQPAFMSYFKPSRLSPDPDHHQDLKDQAQARIAFLLRHVEERFKGPYLFGEHRSVADPYLFILCRWAREAFIDLEDYPRLASFQRHMGLDPDVERVLAQYPLRHTGPWALR